MRGEFAENAIRKDFTPTEIFAITEAVKPKLKADAKKRQQEHGGTAPGKHSGQITTSVGGRARDQIAAFTSVSGKQIEKIADVMAAAQADPQKFGDLPQRMDTQSVNSAHRSMRKRQDEVRVLSVTPITGKFRTLIIDPPCFQRTPRPDFTNVFGS